MARPKRQTAYSHTSGYFVEPIDNWPTKTYYSDDGDRVIPGNQKRTDRWLLSYISSQNIPLSHGSSGGHVGGLGLSEIQIPLPA
jgi:hypothetical protein